MITWDDSMITGVQRIDVQHQRLIEKYNELDEALEQGQGRLVIGEILDFLQFYATWHFGEEETCMDEYRCPIAQANKIAHAEFIDLFGQFYESWQESSLNTEQIKVACAELGNWITTHLRHVDSQLYRCVHGKER